MKLTKLLLGVLFLTAQLVSFAAGPPTFGAIPGAPIIGNAVAGDGSATVSFSTPTSDGGSSITGYSVTSSPVGGVDTNAGTMALTHTITGLTNGTSYTFTVKASNAIGASLASAPSNAVSPTAATGALAIPTYRFNNPITGGHFLSSNESEKAYVLANLTAYSYEGVGFYTFATQVSKSLPVYRFSNSKGFHYFTISEVEKTQLLANAAYQYDGAAFYAYATEVAGSTPVYRFQNSISGSSFYTSTTSEYNYVLQNYPAYVYQNIVFYVRTQP